MVDTLDIIIIVCVVVGALALCFVFFILYWAWQYDRRNRDQFRTSKTGKDQSGGTPETNEANGVDNETLSESPVKKDLPGDGKEESAASFLDNKTSYPAEIGLDPEDNHAYPESVISEDIANNSLRVGSDPLGLLGNPDHDGSVASSMDVESYGYSIEAHSLATGTIVTATDAQSQEVPSSGSILSPTVDEGNE